MRLAYLALDQPELQYTSRELARGMQAPTQWDAEQLKRACRFLLGMPRVVQRMVAQDWPQHVT
eukprot:4535524-Amphidinium_carterae.1